MLGILLDRGSDMPLRRQIYVAMKERMMDGRLAADDTLPSTRELARQLNVSRNTVCEAYDMLIAEGFVLSHSGAATRVAPGLQLDRTPEPPQPQQNCKVRIEVDFLTGRPDLKAFPHYAFGQMLNTAAQRMPLDRLGYTGPHGLSDLRAELSMWLYRSRGITANPADIFITTGATQALHLTANLLYRTGGKILVEDPCHTVMRQMFADRGYQPVPVPVDRQGLRTDQLPADDVCAVYVTPSHQFPLGGILPAGRRAELLRYAKARGCYVIEDDYDSEFRYCGEPVAPLKSMDAQQVIYVGTFSKTMFPALRIGYVILPRLLQERWREMRTYTDLQNPPWQQAAMAQWLCERKFDRHVYRMRKHYAQRREVLLHCLEATFGSACEPWGDAAGLHVAVAFPGRRFGEKFEACCLTAGLRVVPVTNHCVVKGAHEDKLLLGYGHLEPEEIERGIRLLKGILSVEA